MGGIFRVELMQFNKNCRPRLADDRLMPGANGVAYISACRVGAMFIAKDPLKNKNLFATTMLMRRELAIGVIAYQRSGAGNRTAANHLD